MEWLLEHYLENETTQGLNPPSLASDSHALCARPNLDGRLLSIVMQGKVGLFKLVFFAADIGCAVCTFQDKEREYVHTKRSPA